jgi:hypothetical protein
VWGRIPNQSFSLPLIPARSNKKTVNDHIPLLKREGCLFSIKNLTGVLFRLSHGYQVLLLADAYKGGIQKNLI